MKGNTISPMPSKGVAHVHLKLRLALILGIFIGHSQSVKNVEAWDWELSRTSDRKIIGVFHNANSQPVFKFDLCDFFDNNELIAEWGIYSLVHPGCGTKMQEISFWSSPFYACPADGPTHCHRWEKDYHCSAPGCETESDQGGHKDPYISIQRVYPSRDCKPGTCNPFTLKVVAWNGLNAKNWLTGRTWGFVLKFKNYGNSPGVEFTIQKKVPYYQANPIGPEKSWLPQPGIRVYPFSILTPQAISPMVVNLSTVMVKGLQ